MGAPKAKKSKSVGGLHKAELKDTLLRAHKLVLTMKKRIEELNAEIIKLNIENVALRRGKPDNAIILPPSKLIH